MNEHILQDNMHCCIDIIGITIDFAFDEQINQIMPKKLIMFCWTMVESIEILYHLSNERIFFIKLIVLS